MFPIKQHQIGKAAMVLTFSTDTTIQTELIKDLQHRGYLVVTGKVGSMDSQKVVAAVETAAKQNGIIDQELYREEHALYHAIMEALLGVGRGVVSFGAQLRTVGLSFAIVRGRPYEAVEEGEWIAVAFYGTIGAPVKGLEHEALGLGVNHL